MASTEGCSLALSFIEDAPSAVDLAALVDTYSILLFRLANSVLRSRTEAEDVVQDVFIRVLEHRLSLPAVRVGTQDPVIRQTTLEGTSTLVLGKPLVLGSLDIPGSTRHQEVEVFSELVR
jgi:hypothetical protein